jgi:hypothetical protein
MIIRFQNCVEISLLNTYRVTNVIRLSNLLHSLLRLEAWFVEQIKKNRFAELQVSYGFR